jgi:hypothetical protein
VIRECLKRHDRKWYLEDRIDGRHVEDVLGVFGQFRRSPADDRDPRVQALSASSGRSNRIEVPTPARLSTSIAPRP